MFTQNKKIKKNIVSALFSIAMKNVIKSDIRSRHIFENVLFQKNDHELSYNVFSDAIVDFSIYLFFVPR